MRLSIRTGIPFSQLVAEHDVTLASYLAVLTDDNDN